MDYGLILIIAAYLGALQLATRTNASALVCAFVAVGLPYIVNTIILWILVQAHSVSIFADLFPLNAVVTFVLQLVVAFVVFKKIQNDEGIFSTAGWSIGGFILILFLVPFLLTVLL